MINKELSFPQWDCLTKEQQLVILDLLKIIAALENDIEVINEILTKSSTVHQTPLLNKYQVVDSSSNLNLAPEGIQEFIQSRFKRRMIEMPIVPICELCRRLGITDGLCSDCPPQP